LATPPLQRHCLINANKQTSNSRCFHNRNARQPTRLFSINHNGNVEHYAAIVVIEGSCQRWLSKRQVNWRLKNGNRCFSTPLVVRTPARVACCHYFQFSLSMAAAAFDPVAIRYNVFAIFHYYAIFTPLLFIFTPLLSSSPLGLLPPCRYGNTPLLPYAIKISAITPAFRHNVRHIITLQPSTLLFRLSSAISRHYASHEPPHASPFVAAILHSFAAMLPHHYCHYFSAATGCHIIAKPLRHY